MSPSLLMTLINTCARKQLLKFILAVEMDLVDVAYYKKQVFHFLYDTNATPAEELLYISLIL